MAAIALGSNIEPRLGHLQAAVREIRGRGLAADEIREARVYETVPVDCPPGSGMFLNSAVKFQTYLSPGELLKILQEIEIFLGRSQLHARNSPRTVDLDILFYGSVVQADPSLVLPHPRISERLFVLAPLSDLDPHLRLPGQELDIAALREKCPNLDEIHIYSNSISIDNK